VATQERRRQQAKPSKEPFFAPIYPVLSPQMLVPRRREAALPFPFEDPEIRYFELGRDAVYALARAWKFADHEVLFPAYFCGVELDALLAAGARPRFYRVNNHLQVQVEDVVAGIGPKTRAVIIIHYLGFPGPAAELAEICRDRGLLLVEDCAMALLSRRGERPLGSFGDAAIFSIHKTLPIRGGILRLRHDGYSTLPEHSSPSLISSLAEAASGLDRYFQLHRNGLGSSFVTAIMNSCKLVLRRPGAKPLRGEQRHFVSHGGRAISRFSRILLANQPLTTIIERRRRNYLHLAKHLRDVAPPLLGELSLGVCPLFYVFECVKREAVVRQLRAMGVEAVNFWSKHHPAEPKAHVPEVVKLRRTVVALPCHQDLSSDAMDEIADHVRTAMDKLS